MSIGDNVTAGLRLNGMQNKKELAERTEQALVGANLWNEVKDRLDKPGSGLSGGQQQRLCIARAIAVRPEVVELRGHARDLADHFAVMDRGEVVLAGSKAGMVEADVRKFLTV